MRSARLSQPYPLGLTFVVSWLTGVRGDHDIGIICMMHLLLVFVFAALICCILFGYLCLTCIQDFHITRTVCPYTRSWLVQFLSCLLRFAFTFILSGDCAHDQCQVLFPYFAYQLYLLSVGLTPPPLLLYFRMILSGESSSCWSPEDPEDLWIFWFCFASYLTMFTLGFV